MRMRVIVMVMLIVVVNTRTSSQEAGAGDSIDTAISDFHAAFRQSDADRLESLVTDDMLLVTAGGIGESASDFLDGTRELRVERPDMTIDLRSASIAVGPVAWNVASEQGTWIERWTQDGDGVVLQGHYQAMWRYVDGAWRLSALMLVPTECTGPYCE